MAEILYGIERVVENSPFRIELEIWLEEGLRPWFAGRILDIDEQVILTWRRMVDVGRRQNHTFTQPDLFIAATAMVHDLCVVTRNVQDFLMARVPVFNPWTDDAPRTA
jgi:predicted nucleic acid-binding protein